MTRGNEATPTNPGDPGALKVFDYKDGALTNEVSRAPNSGKDFGPRHLDFHPTKWPFRQEIQFLQIVPGACARWRTPRTAFSDQLKVMAAELEPRAEDLQRQQHQQAGG